MDKLVRLVKSFSSSDTGIVYCLTRKETEQVTQHLRQANVRAACYHAYMENKEETHLAWFRNKLQVVVATIAFGLGINKPDVRFVIHFTLSKVLYMYSYATNLSNVTTCSLFFSFSGICAAVCRRVLPGIWTSRSRWQNSTLHLDVQTVGCYSCL